VKSSSSQAPVLSSHIVELLSENGLVNRGINISVDAIYNSGPTAKLTPSSPSGEAGLTSTVLALRSRIDSEGSRMR
jgi:hypothetical protein